MIRSIFFIVVASLSSTLAAQDAQTNPNDWARWRGPTGNAIATSEQTPPTSWSMDTNVIWKSKIPGKGHASPIVIGEKIFLATANPDKQTQSVVCVSRTNGELVWEKQVNKGGLPAKIHPKNTHASSTVATDGKQLFAIFNNHGKINATCLDFEGNIVWNKEVGVYQSFYKFGFGSSPIVHDGKLIITNENKVESAIIAYDVKSGDEAWRIKRDGISSYSTPFIVEVAGKEQLFISGGKTVKSFDPKTGSENWKAKANWDVSCGTMVVEGDMVYASGGFPARHTVALNAKNGKLVWENNIKSYEQSLLAVDGHIYLHSDNGILHCFDAKTGTEKWKKRFIKPVSVSPVLAGGNIYFTAENGETVVVKHDPEKFTEVARNKLGDVAFATPAFCDNRIYTRVGFDSAGTDHQWLYCLGKK